MLGFFRGLWNFITAAKNFTTNIIFLAIVIFILLGILWSETARVPDTAALVIDPTGAIVEQKRPIDPVSRFFSDYEQEPETRLRDLLLAINEGAKDSRVKALVLHLDAMAGAPMSMLEELGSAIDGFRKSGKPVFAFGSSYTQPQYYLASQADHIYIDKHSFQAFGGVFLTGIGIYPTYFKSALEKLKIRVHVFRTGQYKSAVEPYLRDTMSDEAKEANLDWIGQLWTEYANTVVEHRNISLDAFNRYTNEYDVLLGESGNDPVALAVNEGLVDELLSQEQFDERLIDVVGESDDHANTVGFRDYLKITQPPIPVLNPTSDKIAVITAKGTIIDGDQPPGEIGSESLADLITTAREDDSVKALVLRIDSPGGSASAAERIRSELELTQASGKPVVVSMSGYAASGGYWVAASANRILAQETTVTGSIGTFLVFPTFDEALAELGVTTDGVGTTNLSGSLDIFRPLNPVLERTLERSISNTYAKFIDIVAQGRDMSREAVDQIAQGRVWTGKKALELGLIDGIGSLNDAITSAALLADVHDYEVLYMEQPVSTRDRLLNQILNASLETVHKATGNVGAGLANVERISAEMKALVRMSQKPGIYLQCLYCKVVP